MTLRTTVLDLYQARCTLWVEDELTRLVLTEYWNDKRIHVITAGGSEGVRALVAGAPRKVRGRSVVGLVDRDMKFDNRDAWRNPEVHVLRLPVHEFENLLLDFDVLSAISRRESAEIRLHAAVFVAEHAWWMACKHVLHEMRSAVGAHFPEDPGLAKMSEQEAAAFIKDCGFWKAHREAVRTWESPRYIDQRIADIGNNYLTDTFTKDWPRNFSGKEIFRYIRAVVPGLHAHAGGKTPEERDENLAVLFARKLREPTVNKTSPTAKLLDDLRIALHTRAGLS